jgi:hypothetical protein
VPTIKRPQEAEPHQHWPPLDRAPEVPGPWNKAYPIPKTGAMQPFDQIPAQYPSSTPPGTEWLRSQTDQFNEQAGWDFTPEEQFMIAHHRNNLNMGGVPNEGKTSTYLGSTFEVDGRHYMLPTVWDNKIVSPKEAMRRAREVGLHKFPSYPSVEEANRRYFDVLHPFMEQDTNRSGR